MAFLAAGAVLVNGAHAAAQQPNPSAQRAAYLQAIQCFAANNLAKSRRERAGDRAGASRHEANARRSFDTAMSLGQMLSLSNREMNGDLGTYGGGELSRMIESEAYFHQAASACRAYGLM